MRMLPLLLLAAAVPSPTELQQMTNRFAPAELRVDTSALAPGDHKTLVKLIEAARVINEIYLRQLWSGNPALYVALQKDATALGRARLHYFWINKGPWSEIDEHAAFLPGVPPKKLPGANFYPEDITKEEFEAWVKTLSAEERRQAESFFTVIRRDPASRRLNVVPYSREYESEVRRAAQVLREAAALTPNPSLQKFLSLRADAFLSDDYYASDVAWMDLDAPLDVTIGPYETYEDELFGYKAAFEAYVSLRDDQESTRLKSFADRLQEIENNLPIEPQYRNPKIGALAPIRVVNEIFAAGDGAHGIATAAYNLPNDERVIQEKGSKRVMLKNIQQAKFRLTLLPISKRVLAKSAQADVTFDAFFTHILAHELTHGIGPHNIRVAGRETTARKELKDLAGAIEEAKADVTGLFMLDYLGSIDSKRLYTTYLASAFRTLRFGLQDAHAKGMALQFNYLTDKGAFVAEPGGTFAVDAAKIKGAVHDLAHDLLTIEATGDYVGAKKMLDQLGSLRPPLRQALVRLKDIPTDIEPIFSTATAARRAAQPKVPSKAKAKAPRKKR
ncbi:MAG: hypothetical protein HY238_24950 [Acidobacteria bacterium]|nr:hypothetical protein [Acidobacteriota bacterium]